MRKIFLVLALTIFPTLIWAQTAAEISAQTEDDKGFITRLLQDKLSGAGRQVTIDGFRGALSSRATFDQMTISDADGVWITLNDGAIQWNRSALLRGRIEVGELSAAEILLPRLPGVGGEAKAEAGEFALPDLPVGINIDKIEAARVELGEPVIGLPASVSLSGTMQLAGGEGTAVLSIDRLDGPRGQFALDAGYSNETKVLKLDLKLDEDADGLFVNLVDLYDKPSVVAEISGEGPLSEFVADINLATDGQPRVTGRASAVSETAENGDPGTAFRLELGGDVASLLPPENRTFFGPDTQFLADGWRGQNGRIELPVLMIDTDALNLSGSLTANDQGAPQSAVILMTFGADAGATELPVLLPFGEDLRVNDGRLTLQYDAAEGAGWTLQGRVGAIDTAGTRIGALTLDGGGLVSLNGGALEGVTGKIDFGATGIEFDDAGLAQAVGEAITGQTDFDFTPGNAVELSGLTVNGTDYGLAGNLLVSGLAGGITLSGDMNARYDALARLSTLAGRPVTGRADAQLSGVYTVLTNGFFVDADINGTDITVDQKQLDRLLEGEAQITLQARRDVDGVTLDDLRINAQRLTAEASGYLNSDSTDVKATLRMPSLTDADPEFGGSLVMDGFLTGPTGQRRLTLTGDAEDLRVGIPELAGALQGKTSLAVIAAEKDGIYAVERFSLSNAQLTADGEGNFGQDTLDARLNLSMPDLTVLGRGWSGGVTAEALALAEDGARRLEVKGKGTDLRLGQEQVDAALVGDTDLALSAIERDGVITLNNLNLSNGQMDVTAGGIYGEGVTDLTAEADIRSLGSFGSGWRGSVRADASLREDGTGGRRLVVDATGQDVGFGQAQLDGALRGTSRLALRGVERDGVFTIDEARIASPNVNGSATGSVGGGATDLDAQLVAGDLRFLGNGIAGAISADASVTEQAGQRRIVASGTATGLSVGQERVDPLLAGQTIFDLAATQGPQGLSVERLMVRNPQLQVTADGSPTAGLNVDARLSDLRLVNPALQGPAQVTGTLREDGPNYAVNLAAQAPGGTRAQISGSAARDGSTADLRISGLSDAAIANPFLRTRSVEGPVSFDLRLQGRPSLDALSGQVQLTNGRLVDPKLGVRMDNLSLTADLAGGRINVNGGGAMASGGQLTISGPVDIASGTLDIAIGLNDVVVRDPNLYEATLRGSLRISGEQAAGPLVSGQIDVLTAEIRIPSTGLGGAKSIPDIRHVGDDQDVRSTRAKAGLAAWPSRDAVAAGMSGPAATPPANPPRLDLTINAPNQFFIRGRGVDAEMGGSLRLTGTSRNVVPIGTLELIRGRVDLLGKRFDLTEGLVELQGSLMPVIRLVAETEQDGITTRVIIDGEARDPDITFESSPDLPQEEVLSQLLFGRGLDNISPLQAAQLANAVAVLAGRGGEGIIGRLRSGIGLDDLDLATDDEGNVQVRAGKYLSENVYSDVSVDDSGKSQINLNLDINETLRARGSVNTDGESTIGVYFERDY